MPAHADPTLEPCGETLLADWTEDGRIDEVYAPRCYRDALARLPEDVRTYTSAHEDIAGALYQRVRSVDQKPAARSQGGPVKPKRTLASSAPAPAESAPQPPPIEETGPFPAANPSVVGAVAALFAGLLVVATLARRRHLLRRLPRPSASR